MHKDVNCYFGGVLTHWKHQVGVRNEIEILVGRHVGVQQAWTKLKPHQNIKFNQSYVFGQISSGL